MRGEIQRLQRALGVTTLYVTHDQTEAMTMGDLIAVMDDGVVRQTRVAGRDLTNAPWTCSWLRSWACRR